jgi:hypothetical protein
MDIIYGASLLLALSGLIATLVDIVRDNINNITNE